jgi:hypothetical protein
MFVRRSARVPLAKEGFDVFAEWHEALNRPKCRLMSRSHGRAPDGFRTTMGASIATSAASAVHGRSQSRISSSVRTCRASSKLPASSSAASPVQAVVPHARSTPMSHMHRPRPTVASSSTRDRTVPAVPDNTLGGIIGSVAVDPFDELAALPDLVQRRGPSPAGLPERYLYSEDMVYRYAFGR